MNLNTSILVIIKNGVGELQFPQALKRDLFMSTINCKSLFIEANESATNKGFLIVCLKDKHHVLCFLGFLPSHIPSVLSSWQRGRC